MAKFVIAYDDGSGRMEWAGDPHPTPEAAMLDSGMKPGETPWGVNPNQLLMVENGNTTVIFVPKGTILLSEEAVFRLQGEIKRLTEEVKRLQALAAKGEERGREFGETYMIQDTFVGRYED